VTSQSFSKTGGLLKATEGDHKPGKNIFPFGICSQTKKACSPAPLQWNGVESWSKIEGKGKLTNDSVLPCALGGIISCKENGQYFSGMEDADNTDDNYGQEAERIISSLPEQGKEYEYLIEQEVHKSGYDPHAKPPATLAEAKKVMNTVNVLKSWQKSSNYRAHIARVDNYSKRRGSD
jgi:hypothetical protein